MFPTLPATLTPQTITGLTAQIKSLLEEAFYSVCVVGEVTSLSVPGSGHVYFTLKDKNACLPCVMWRTTAQRHRYAMKDGTEVVVVGKLTVYPPQGKYQLTVDRLFESGVGAQDQALQKLKEKLKGLGYFAAERKRALPKFPCRVALVTARSGAAIRDMLEIIGRRWPTCEIWVVGVRVQGPGAREEIAFALERLNQFDGVDAIILGRGGGSREDLAAFNEEVVARAIFGSRIPVISAVGHEIDVTIADLVADFRAATPSEAAERAMPDRLEWLNYLGARQQRLRDLLTTKYHAQLHRLEGLLRRRVFQFPLERLHEQERRVDDREVRMRRAMMARLQRLQQKLGASAAHLESLSPLNVLARGYSLTRTAKTRKVVRSIGQVKAGGAIEIFVADGVIDADVKGSKPHGEE